MSIDFDSYITPANHFKWREALHLNSIGVFHVPSDHEIQSIILTCTRLDKVREFLGKPISVNCWIRPNSVNCSDPKYTGFDYNKLVNGAKASAHIFGLAVDFVVSGLSVDEVMKLITPKLEEFKLAAENNGSITNRNWVHLQSRPLPDGSYRVFNP